MSEITAFLGKNQPKFVGSCPVDPVYVVVKNSPDLNGDNVDIVGLDNLLSTCLISLVFAFRTRFCTYSMPL